MKFTTNSPVTLSVSKNSKLLIIYTGHVQNPPAIKTHPFEIHPIKFENRLSIKGNSDSEKWKTNKKFSKNL